MLQFRPVVAAYLYCNLLRSNHFQIFLVRVSRHPVLSRNYWFHQFLSNVSVVHTLVVATSLAQVVLNSPLHSLCFLTTDWMEGGSTADWLYC